MSALATPDRSLPLDVLLRTLRHAGLRDNPWAEIPGTEHTWAAFRALAHAAADFVDRARIDLSYADAVDALRQLAAEFPAVPDEIEVPEALRMTADDFALVAVGRPDGDVPRRTVPAEATGDVEEPPC